MALQDTNVPFQFGPGVDTKTDAKAVKAKLLQMQDCVFTQAGQINKRNGYEGISTAIIGGGNLVAPQMVSSFQNQLVCQDQGILYSYSATNEAWIEEGYYISCQASTIGISASATNQLFQSACLWNGYGIYTWTQAPAASRAAYAPQYATWLTYLSIRDQDTGVYLTTSSTPFATQGRALHYQTAKTFVLGNNAIPGSVTVDNNGNVTLYTYSISNAGVIVNGPFTLYTAGSEFVTDGTFSMEWAAPSATLVPIFEAVSTSTGGVVAFGTTSNNLRAITFDINGNVLHTFSFATGGTINGVSVCVGSNGNIWIYYVDSAQNLRYTVLTSTLTTVLAPATLVATTGVPIRQFSVIAKTPTTQEFFYSIDNNVPLSYNPGPAISSTNIQYGTANSTGSGNTNTFLVSNLDICGKPVIYGGKTYILTVFYSFAQATVFFLGVDGFFPGAPISKMFAGSAYGFAVGFQDGVEGPNPIILQTAAYPFSYTASPLAITADQIGFLLPEVVTVDTLSSASRPLTASVIAAFNFAHPDLYQSITANNTLVMNGGILWQFDGAVIAELGFNLYPEIVAAVVSTTGGGLGAGDYSWAVIFQWTDTQGNYNQSAPGLFTVQGMTGATNSVTLTIRVPGVSIKLLPAPPSITIFRTQVNEDNYTLVDNSNIYNRGTPGITYVDVQGDDQISPDDDLYTNGGVIENIGPPPSTAMALFNNRLWIVDSTNPNTIWYSKTFQPGVAISTSDLLVDQVNAIGGNIVAIAAMDSNLVVFEQNLPLVITGDGDNDAGTGSTLTPAQPIPSDAGCTTSKGIIVFPQGILRKTPKGIYRLDRSLNDSYWGYLVEKYNSQIITATTLMEDKTQIRFLCSSGLTLVYDYFMNQWGTFSNHTGLSACLWQGTYVYARNDGSGNIYEETPGIYLDLTTPISPLIQLGWLAFSSIQNLERVREFLMLGNFIGSAAGHGVQVSFAYNWSTTFTPVDTYYLSNSPNAPVYQFRGFLERQKCDAVSITVQEITTGDPSEYITFTDMSFVAAIKRGLHKLPAANTVG